MTISFSGLASGLDTSAWVESLTALKRAKVTKFEEQKEAISVSKTALSQIKSYFNAFRSSLERITDAKFNINSIDLFTQNLAISSNTSKLIATATSEAEEKTYNITVEKLATLTKAKSRYKDTVTTTAKATETSRLKNIEGYNTTAASTSGTMNIEVTVDGVKHALSIRETDAMSSIVSKFQAIGVDARYNEQTGKLSLNTSTSCITGTSAAEFKSLFHLEGVNEGYETSKLQYSSIKTTEIDAVLDTTISALIANRDDLAALGIDSNYLNTAKTVNVQNSTNNDITTFTVNSGTRIGDFINQLKSAGLYACLNKDGCLEITGGQIVGGTFDAINVFGLYEQPESAMVTGSILTETIIIPDIVDLNTRLVEDLGVTRGFFEVTNPDSTTFYLSVYSGQTMADLISDLGHVGIDGDLDSQSGILTLRGGEYKTLTDAEVQELCSGGASALIPGVSPQNQQGTNLLSCLGLDVEANMQVLSTRSKSRALTYSQVNYMTDDGLISDFVTLPANKTLVVHEHTGEAIGTVTVDSTSTFGSLFADLSQYDVDGEIHDGVIMFDSNRQLYVTGDLLTELGMSTDYETFTVTTTLGTTQSTSAKTYTATQTATNESTISDFITIGSNNTIVVRDQDGHATQTVTVDGSQSFGDLFVTLSNYGVDADLVNGQITFNTDNDGYVDGSFITTALGCSVRYDTVITTKTVGSTSTGSLKTYNTTSIATDQSKISDFITLSNSNNKLYIKGENNTNLASITITNTMTFGELFATISSSSSNMIDCDIEDGIVTFNYNDFDVTNPTSRFLDGSFVTALGAATTISSITVTQSSAQTTSTLTHSVEETAAMNSKISDFVSITAAN